MHICFVSREFGSGGGIGTYVWEIARGLREAGHEVSVISDGRLREDREPPPGVTSVRVIPRTPSSQSRLYRVERHVPWFALTAARALRTLARTRPVDLVETAEFDADGLIAAFMPRRFPLVVRFHSGRRLIDHIAPPDVPATSTYWCERQLIARADALTSPSAAIVAPTFEVFGLQPRPCTVIPNPIGLNAPPREVARTAGEIAYIGRLETRKGIVALGAAVPLVLRERLDLRFVFIGADGIHPDGGSFREYICAQLTERQRAQVSFEELGRGQVPARLAQADISVLPSVWENFPYTLLESMSVGTPAIVSPHGGMPEVVTHMQDGIVLEAPDAANIARSILNVYANRDLLEAMRQRARTTVETRFRTDVVVKQMVAAYQRFIESRRGAR